MSSLQRKILLAAIDDLVKSSIDDPPPLSGRSAASFSSSHDIKDSDACSVTFYEFRERDWKLFDQLTGSRSTAPRWAISLLPRLPDHAQPASPFRKDFPMNWIVWFFVPEYYLWKNSPTIACGLAWAISMGHPCQHDTPSCGADPGARNAPRFNCDQYDSRISSGVRWWSNSSGCRDVVLYYICLAPSCLGSSAT